MGGAVSSNDGPPARLEDQIAWYDKKSSQNQRTLKQLKVDQLASVAGIPVPASTSATPWSPEFLMRTTMSTRTDGADMRSRPSSAGERSRLASWSWRLQRFSAVVMTQPPTHGCFLSLPQRTKARLNASCVASWAPSRLPTRR
jgi:hypothetical protein